MSAFEAIMLICFGASWPISIAKSLRTRMVVGKSPFFMAIVCVGYLSGVLHKCFYSLDWVTALYALNMAMVAVDLVLYFRFLPKPQRAPAENWKDTNNAAQHSRSQRPKRRRA